MRHLKITTALFMGFATLCPPALAQADEIVVTATRAPAPRSNLPADVTIIDADAARARGEITIEQALAQVPGIQAPRTGGLGQQTSIFSGGFESNHTLVLFDGVRLDDASTPQGVFDAGQDTLGAAERIEIVRGPLSALYGSGALGGVVNLMPRRGGVGAINSSLDVAAGSFDTLTATIGVDGTLGRLRYALTGEGYASEGFDIVPERINTHTGEDDGADISTATGVFDFAASDTLSVDLLLRRRDAQVDYDPGIFGNIDENPFAEIDSDSALWRLGADWSPNDAFSMRASGGALDTDRVQSDAGIVGDTYGGERRFADISAALSLSNWTLVGGITGEDESIDAVSFGSPIAGAQDHLGVFLSAQGGTGPFNVTAAVRHDDFSGFGGETTWRGGAAYQFGESARVYASYGTSYRAPSLYERFVPFFGAAGLQPESAQTWEIGADARFSLFGRADGLELNAIYRDSVIEDLIGFFGFSYANVDEAEIRFTELRVASRPLEWLTLRAAYANTDARDASTDIQLQRRPLHAWSAEAELNRGPLTASLSWREVGARRDVIYDDAGFFFGSGRVEAYEVVRASARWALNDAVSLYIAGDNLLDETYEPVNGFAGAPPNVLIGVRVTR